MALSIHAGCNALAQIHAHHDNTSSLIWRPPAGTAFIFLMCRNILEVPVKFSAAEQQAYDAIKQEFETDEDENEDDPASGSDTDLDSGQKPSLEVQTAPALGTVHRKI